MKSYHVKKGDKVTVISGLFKRCEAEIAAVLPEKDRVVLTFTAPGSFNQKQQEKFGKQKTVKKSQANPNGGMIQRSVSVHVSNVALTEEAKKAKAEAIAAKRAAKAAAKADGVK
ncbi:MAG: hypothetical protein MST10_08150 [Lentisphaeria bacterium]|nr:hypothetical protein [Lentisphaeria bacterium]